VLSGGERSRLSLIKLLLAPYNLLVLDEPTNHLDMRSKEILKKALIDYKGTLILVSHDRDFLDGLIDKVYEFKNRRIRENVGGIYEFLSKKKQDILPDFKKDLKSQKNSKGHTIQKSRFLQSKEAERNIRKLKTKIQKLEAEINELEKKIASLDTRLANPDEKMKKGDSHDIYLAYQKLQSDLNDRLIEWEKLQLKLDSLIGPRD